MEITLQLNEVINILKSHFENTIKGENITVKIDGIDNIDDLKIKAITETRRILVNNSKLNAIKYIRLISGLSIPENKAIVDSIQQGAKDDLLISMFSIQNIKAI